MPSYFCTCCGRHLTVAESIQRGVGPICFGRQLDEIVDYATGDAVDLPFDPVTMDIICRRDEDGSNHFNIFQIFKHHSPSGMSWNYLGSGPADFALNIVALFTAALNEPRTIVLWDGKKVGVTAWNLHQRFKQDFVATLPKEGGVIKGHEIRTWMAAQIDKVRALAA